MDHAREPLGENGAGYESIWARYFGYYGLFNFRTQVAGRPTVRLKSSIGYKLNYLYNLIILD